MLIYLIRHGQTTGDIEDRYGGNYDDHLTEKGKEQVEELSKLLKKVGIQKLFHSPRFRAKESAIILAKNLKVPLEQVDDIRERNNYGIMSGMVKAEAKKKYPKEVAKLDKDKTFHNVKESEKYDDFKCRVLAAFHYILDNKKEVIGIVSHGGPISCLLRELFQYKIKIEDCGFFELEFDGRSVKLLSVNGAEIEDL